MALHAAAAAMSIRRTFTFLKNGQIFLLALTNGWIGTPLHMRQCNSLAAAQLNASDRKMEVSACSAIKTSARGQVRGEPHGGGVDWMESTENIQLINTAMGMEHYFSNEIIELTGKSLTWGIESEWTLKSGLAGRFHEQLKNAEFTHEWGHDGKLPWHADAAGRVSRLELDEGEVVAHVVVDKQTCFPLQMSFQKFCFRDRWKFSNWQYVLPDRQCRLPIFSSKASSSVVQENFKIVKVVAKTSEGGNTDTALFDCPLSSLVPR